MQSGRWRVSFLVVPFLAVAGGELLVVEPARAGDWRARWIGRKGDAARALVDCSREPVQQLAEAAKVDVGDPLLQTAAEKVAEAHRALRRREQEGRLRVRQADNARVLFCGPYVSSTKAHHKERTTAGTVDTALAVYTSQRSSRLRGLFFSQEVSEKKKRETLSVKLTMLPDGYCLADLSARTERRAARGKGRSTRGREEPLWLRLARLAIEWDKGQQYTIDRDEAILLIGPEGPLAFIDEATRQRVSVPSNWRSQGGEHLEPAQKLALNRLLGALDEAKAKRGGVEGLPRVTRPEDETVYMVFFGDGNTSQHWTQ